jgi:hypothetical protein
MKHKYRNLRFHLSTDGYAKKIVIMQTINICAQTIKNQLISEAVYGDEMKFWLDNSFAIRKKKSSHLRSNHLSYIFLNYI